MGAIFAMMKLNSSPYGVHYRERGSAHPHCSPAKRDLADPKEWVSLVGGVKRTYRMEWGEAGGWVLMGREEEGDHKHWANDLKLTAQRKLMQQHKCKNSAVEQTAECFRQERFEKETRYCVFLVHDQHHKHTRTGSPALQPGLSGHISLVAYKPLMHLHL